MHLIIHTNLVLAQMPLRFIHHLFIWITAHFDQTPFPVRDGAKRIHDLPNVPMRRRIVVSLHISISKRDLASADEQVVEETDVFCELLLEHASPLRNRLPLTNTLATVFKL